MKSSAWQHQYIIIQLSCRSSALQMNGFTYKKLTLSEKGKSSKSQNCTFEGQNQLFASLHLSNTGKGFY